MLFAYLSVLLVGLRAALCSEPKVPALENIRHTSVCEFEWFITRAQKVSSLASEDYAFLHLTTLRRMDCLSVQLKTDLFQAVRKFKRLMLQQEEGVKKCRGMHLILTIIRDKDPDPLSLFGRYSVLHEFERKLILSALLKWESHSLFWECVCEELEACRGGLVLKIRETYGRDLLPDPQPDPQADQAFYIHTETLHGVNNELVAFDNSNTRYTDNIQVHKECVDQVLSCASVLNYGLSLFFTLVLKIKDLNIFFILCIIILTFFRRIFRVFGPGTAGHFAPGYGYCWSARDVLRAVLRRLLKHFRQCREMFQF